MIFTKLFGNCLTDQLKDGKTLAYAAGELNTPMQNQDRKSAFLKMKKGCCEGGTPSCGLFKPPTEGPDGLMASLLRMSMSTTNCCSILFCVWMYSKYIVLNIDIYSSVKIYITMDTELFETLCVSQKQNDVQCMGTGPQKSGQAEPKKSIVTIHFVGNKYLLAKIVL